MSVQRHIVALEIPSYSSTYTLNMTQNNIYTEGVVLCSGNNRRSAA